LLLASRYLTKVAALKRFSKAALLLDTKYRDQSCVTWGDGRGGTEEVFCINSFGGQRYCVQDTQNTEGTWAPISRHTLKTSQAIRGRQREDFDEPTRLWGSRTVKKWLTSQPNRAILVVRSVRLYAGGRPDEIPSADRRWSRQTNCRFSLRAAE